MSGAPPSSIAAWNEYLKSFVSELCETFPECPDLFVLVNTVEAMIEEDENSVLTKFIDEIEPHTDALTNMDENFFLNGNIDFLEKLGVRKYWTPELEDETKQAIWQYLQTLLVMGKTIQSVPPHMLRMLEDYANKVTSQIDSGEIDQSQLDMQTLGLGAFQHMTGGASTSAAPSTHSAPSAPSGGMFGNIFDSMDAAQLNSMANMFSVQAPAGAGSGTGNGGFDRLFNQFSGAGAHTQVPTVPPVPPGSIWGTANPPLYGHHPMFFNNNNNNNDGRK